MHDDASMARCRKRDRDKKHIDLNYVWTSLRAGSLFVVGPRENAKGRRRAERMGRGKVSLHASF